LEKNYLSLNRHVALHLNEKWRKEPTLCINKRQNASLEKDGTRDPFQVQKQRSNSQVTGEVSQKKRITPKPSWRTAPRKSVWEERKKGDQQVAGLNCHEIKGDSACGKREK